MSRTILYASEHITVVHAEASTDTVVVTFAEMGQGVDGTRFWGDSLLDKMGVSAIGFVSARPNWYPLADTRAAIAAVRACIRARRVITYGYSQGGYGALKFSKILVADTALAFSPQWSIDPADVATFDARYMGYHDPSLHNGSRIEQCDLGSASYIFSDWLEPADQENTRKLLALERTHWIAMPFTGHDSIRLISESGLGSSLLRLCLSQPAPPAAAFRKLIRTARSRSTTYAKTKLSRLYSSAARHPSYLSSAIQHFEEGDFRKVAELRLCLARSDMSKALAILGNTTDAALQQMDLVTLWTAFRGAGFIAGEERIARLFKLRHPDVIWLRLHGVNSLLQVGSNEEAAEELAILAAMPGAKAYASHFTEFATRLGLSRLDLIGDVEAQS